jgi:cytochrome c-type biogenesis protein CcmF
LAPLGSTFIAVSGVSLVFAVVLLVKSNQSGSSAARRRGFSAFRISTVSLTMSCIVLLALFLKRDFGVAYVASYSSRDLPLFYLLSAFWAGQEGSLLLWAWFMSVFGLVLTRKDPASTGTDLASPVIVLSLVILGFLAMLLGAANPFTQVRNPGMIGAGLNPLLQNPAMVIHPPLVFIGYAGFAITFALGLGSLISGDPRGRWVRRADRWTIFSWLTLGLGILLGARWAYDELGWGGYWSWDAVENSSLLPWLVGTALVHSLIVQRVKNKLSMPTLLLAAFTFIFCMFGTFLTRSGVISSVHAFAESAIGYYFLGMILLLLAGSIWLIIYRAGYLASRKTSFGVVSKESSIAAFNLILIVLTAIVLFGTCYPIFTRLFSGRQVELARPFFDRATAPLGVLIVLLLGFCPHVKWGGFRERLRLKPLALPGVFLILGALICAASTCRSPGFLLTSAFSGLAIGTVLTLFINSYIAARGTGRKRLRSFLEVLAARRSGAYIVHLGVVLMSLGIGASSVFESSEKAVLYVGQTMNVGQYTLKYVDLDDRTVRNRYEVIAELEVSRKERPIGLATPAKAYYTGEERPMSEVSVISGLLADLYVVLGGLSEDGSISIEAHVNPLVNWIWIGGGLFFVGGLVILSSRARSALRSKTKSGGR